MRAEKRPRGGETEEEGVAIAGIMSFGGGRSVNVSGGEDMRSGSETSPSAAFKGLFLFRLHRRPTRRGEQGVAPEFVRISRCCVEKGHMSFVLL